MIEKEVLIVNRAGMHTRPASQVVKLASKFKSEISLERDGFVINAKSIIGVMTLAAEQGAKLKLIIKGDDENQAMEELCKLFESGFGEDI